MPIRPSPSFVIRAVCAYDDLSKEELQALPNIAEDTIRSNVDLAIMTALGIEDDLSIIRRLLCAEPIIPAELPA